MRHMRFVAWVLAVTLFVNSNVVYAADVSGDDFDSELETFFEIIEETESTFDFLTYPETEVEDIYIEETAEESEESESFILMDAGADEVTLAPYVLTEAISLYELFKIILVSLGVGITAGATIKMGAEFADYVQGSSALSFNASGTKEWRVIQGGKKPDDDGNLTDDPLVSAAISVNMIEVVKKFLEDHGIHTNKGLTEIQSFVSDEFTLFDKSMLYFGETSVNGGGFETVLLEASLLSSSDDVFFGFLCRPIDGAWVYPCLFSYAPFRGQYRVNSHYRGIGYGIEESYNDAINRLSTLEYYNFSPNYLDGVYYFKLGAVPLLIAGRVASYNYSDLYFDKSEEEFVSFFASRIEDNLIVASEPVFNLNDILGKPIRSDQASVVADALEKSIDPVVGDGSTLPPNFEEVLKNAVRDALAEAGITDGGGTDPTQPTDPQPEPEPDPEPGFDPTGILQILSKILSAILGLPSQLISGLADALYALFAPLIKLLPGQITEGFAQGVDELIDFFKGWPALLLSGLSGLHVVVTGPDGLPIDWPSIFPFELPEFFKIEWPDKFPWEMPEIKFSWPEEFPWQWPEIKFLDYFDILGEILNAILVIPDVFKIDVPRVRAATQQAIDSIGQDSGLGEIAKIFAAIQFEDSYDYPVIAMQTPDILRQFYDHDEIVLLDFGDYAEYVLFARNVFRVSLWLSFLWWGVRQCKVQLHIG